MLAKSHRVRFAAVISHPIQHYSPLFRHLADNDLLATRVFYCCDHGARSALDPDFNVEFRWDVDLTSGYDFEVLRPGYSPRRFSPLEIDSPEIGEKLDEFAPDAVWIHGYAQAFTWRAMRWAARRRARTYLFADSELLHQRNALKRLAKQAVLPRLLRRFDRLLTIGDNNELYYRYYGARQEQILRIPCPVDLRRFWQAKKHLSKDESDDGRAALGIPRDAFVVVQSGKMVPWKRPTDLVSAVAELARRGHTVFALFVGDGPLRGEIVDSARRAGVSHQIKLAGFVNQSKLPSILCLANAVAITSSRDAHPLSVTESIALGQPVIVSDRVGCIGPTDTARSGVNAIVYQCGNTSQLAKAIEGLARDAHRFRRMSDASYEISRTQDVRVAAEILSKDLLAGSAAMRVGTLLQ